jgi:hypothetical protein
MSEALGSNLSTEIKKKFKLCWVLVAHACNPNYSEDRDQEDHGSKPALSK